MEWDLGDLYGNMHKNKKTMSMMYSGAVTVGPIYIISMFALLLPTAVSQNLALGKPVGGSGNVGGYPLYLSVDGKLGVPDCALPVAPQGSNVEWWVDLQDTYRVTSIILYNTDGMVGDPTWLRYFILSVGASLSDLTDCGPEFTGYVSNGGHVTRDCNQTGRFVHFRRTGGGNKPNYVVLCEVQVFGRNQYNVSWNSILTVAVLVTAVGVAAISISGTYLVMRERRTRNSRNTNIVQLDPLPYEKLLLEVDHAQTPVIAAPLGAMTQTNEVKEDAQYEVPDPQVQPSEPSVYDEIRAASPAR